MHATRYMVFGLDDLASRRMIVGSGGNDQVGEMVSNVWNIVCIAGLCEQYSRSISRGVVEVVCSTVVG